MSGDIFSCHNAGGGVGARDAAEHPMTQRTATHNGQPHTTEKSPAPRHSSAKVENSGCVRVMRKALA